jgi:hypothetical protein
MATTVTPTHLSLEIHVTHQDCLNAETWRKATGQSGFPIFEPVLHERYNANRTYLKCQACGTVISHGICNRTDVESA